MKDETLDTLPSLEEVNDALRTDDDILAGMTPEEAEIAKKLLLPLAAKANRMAEANKAKELEKLSVELQVSNRKLMEEELAKFRKANEPLTSEELTKLLTQEYLEFTFTGGRKTQLKQFTIQELPIAVEKRLLKVLRATIFGTLLKEISAIDWASSGGISGMERVAKILDMVPGALDVLAEVCATCLDPDKEQDITADWVVNNMSVDRMYTILNAQATASRWRDFFSRVYQAIPSQMMG